MEYGVKTPSDTEMLDWLSRQDCVKFEVHYNPMVEERTRIEKESGGYNGHIDFFSIPSQHLNNVTSLRKAVAMAMKRKKKKR